MKTTNIVPTILSLALCASCSAPKGMSVQQYASTSRASSVSTAPVEFQMTTHEPRRSPTQYPPQKLSIGRAFQVGAQREFIYPTTYEPANVSGGSLAITPATPTGFKSVNTGLVADLTTKRVGGLILIEGSVTVTEFQGFSRMGGALGQPILDSKDRLITDNRIEMPKLATYTTPVYVAIKPGESSTFDLSSPTKGAKATFSLIQKK
jgi:hypothetical protein